MSNNKQSSVEWLDRWFRDNPEATYEERNAALQQAKEKHKEEIENAWNSFDGKTFEQYYNETYGNNTP
jgi:hypothetical protein